MTGDHSRRRPATPIERRRTSPRAASAILALALLPALTVAGTVPQAHAATTISAHKIVGGLNWPAAFTFTPNGKIFYGERFTGEVHLYNPTTGGNRLVFTIPRVVDNSNGEQGLLGLALHPQYPQKAFLFAYATRNVNGGRYDQIVRIALNGGVGTSMRVIFSGSTTSGTYHDGGRILFGPDGYLYAVMGEAHTRSNAQNLSNPAGKVLRMTTNGQAPAGNPGFADPLIWSYGLRNSFGFTFDPRTGSLWETENGPECNDEINRIVKGRSFGWGPSESCSGSAPRNTNRDGPNPVLPLRWYTPTIAPTGTAFCDGCGLGGASEGALFFNSWDDGEIHRLLLTPDRKGIASDRVVYRHGSGLVSMEVGPDGRLYFSDAGAIWRLRTG